MKYVDEYRDPQIALRIAERIASEVTRPWVLMEVCGGQTHTLMRYGLEELLPTSVELVHGSGCPVCVSSAFEDGGSGHSDRLAPGCDFFTSYGDMLRVPGSESDLLQIKARARRRYSGCLFAHGRGVNLARANPDRQGCLLRRGL